MQPNRIGVLLAAPIAILVFGSCGTSEDGPALEKPLSAEEIAGTEFWRLTLTASAIERLGVQTTSVETADAGRVVPRAAVIIGPAGKYWVYTNPEPFVFIRQEIESVYEEGQQAFFSDGPAIGTLVVTIGVPELYGAEFGIGK